MKTKCAMCGEIMECNCRIENSKEIGFNYTLFLCRDCEDVILGIVEKGVE